MENRLLSIAEVAEFLNVSKRTVQRLIKRGSLRAMAVGGQKRSSRFALEEMLRGDELTHVSGDTTPKPRLF